MLFFPAVSVAFAAAFAVQCCFLVLLFAASCCCYCLAAAAFAAALGSLSVEKPNPPLQLTFGPDRFLAVSGLCGPEGWGQEGWRPEGWAPKGGAPKGGLRSRRGFTRQPESQTCTFEGPGLQ